MIIAALVFGLVGLQEPSEQTVVDYTVLERIQLTAEQTEAVSLLMALGSAVGRCADRLPVQTRQALEAGIQSTVSGGPDGRYPSLADVAFLQAYGNAAAGPSPQLTDTQCAAELADRRLLIEGSQTAVDALIARSELETRRPWRLIAQEVVDAGAPPRQRPALADPAGLRAAGGSPTPPQWAAPPSVRFPVKARGAMKTGSAVIECIVTTRGRARDCRLVSESAGGYGFGEEALAAEASYRFRPSTVAGQPLESRSTFTIRFSQPEPM
jgi:TonB family protein